MNKSYLYILGIPLLLLALFLIIDNGNVSDKEITSQFNPYLKPLPQQYIEAVEQNKDQDSVFFSTVIESDFSRELVVLKASPNDLQLNRKFKLQLFPLKQPGKKKSKPINFKITDQATVYNYKGKTYALYNKSIPHINYSKIVIRKIAHSKKIKPWKSTINSPYTPLDDISYESKKSAINKSIPNSYKFLYTELLKQYNIASIPYRLEVVKDSLFEIKDGLKKYIKTNDETIGEVKSPFEFWSLLNNKSEFKGGEIVFEGKQSSAANNQIKKYLNKEIALDELIDLEKLAYYFAIDNLFSKKCINTLHFSFNTTHNKLEPFFVSSKCLGHTSNFVKNPRVDNSDYTFLLTQALNEISQINIEKELIDSKESFIKQQTLINAFFSSKNIRQKFNKSQSANYKKKSQSFNCYKARIHKH